MNPDPFVKNNVTVRFHSAEAPNLIFAHGFGTDQNAWNEIHPAFANTHNIYCFDNVGAGLSDPAAYLPQTYKYLEAYADDLLAICEQANLQNITLVGHSVSGIISVLASIKKPALFQRLILIGANARYLNDGEYIGGFEQSDLDQFYGLMSSNYHAWVSGFAPAVMGYAERPELAAQFAASLSALRPDIAQSVARAIFQSDYRNQLARVQHPTLLIQTQHDLAVPASAAAYLHRNIPGSQLVTIPAEGHFPHISVPGEVIGAIKNFLL